MDIKLYRIADRVPFFEANDIEVLYSNGTYSFRGVPINDRYTFAKIRWHKEDSLHCYTAETLRSVSAVNLLSLDTSVMRIFDNEGTYLFSPVFDRYNTGMGQMEMSCRNGEVFVQDKCYHLAYRGYVVHFECTFFKQVENDSIVYGRSIGYKGT